MGATLSSSKHHSNVDPRILIGNEQCTQPYSASRLNISALSFGALSKMQLWH